MIQLHSLRWRVQRGHIIVMLLIGPLAISVPYLRERHQSLNEADARLALAIAHTPTAEFLNGTEVADDKYDNKIWYSIYDNKGVTINKSEHFPNASLTPNSYKKDSYLWVNDYRILTIKRSEDAHTIIAGIHKSHVFHHHIALLASGVFIFLLIVIGALWLTWWDAGRALQPIRNFTQIAQRINRKKDPQLIDLEGTEYELRELGEVLNQAFERMHLSLQQQRNFTADASHELRTPISIILLELESALRKERKPEEYKERIQAALETTEQLMQLIDSLLTLARSDAGLTHVTKTEANLQKVCEDAVRLMQPKALEANCNLTLKAIPLLLPHDSARIRQVLVNLINNALQYAGRGAKIQILLRKTDTCAELIVSDNGPGIPAAARGQIFDRFYRHDNARNREHGNLGLGLSICKSIIEAHEGTIHIIDSETPGAHFQIKLPID